MLETNPSSSPRLYGRRKGRPLHKRKSALVETLLPQLEIKWPTAGVLNPLSLFKFKPKEIWLEVGFGGGEHLTAQAARHPDIGFIGCEPFLNGIASLLEHIDQQHLTNIRVFPDDARKVLDALPDASLSWSFVLYPDPWPKKRHAERRFINAENMQRFARAFKSDAELRLATDVAPLAAWMEERASAHPDFRQTYCGTQPPADWIQTRYEQKGLKAGRSPTYLCYRKR